MTSASALTPDLEATNLVQHVLTADSRGAQRARSLEHDLILNFSLEPLKLKQRPVVHSRGEKS
ncbi:hypothetical protein CVT26_000660 [Gymnopilus dilepis]|uniref:Uncharacterized protein n=1 Tax=Gymnopilus dilepis TaxID=231916 RepID=A0A409Y2R1_9AGAR|nr:hypothetical protein CVT26_000660 [Gymnopilus dilepis]